jgi:1,4-alpha-glucan branching enzyme
MSIQKHFFPGRGVCQVHFSLPLSIFDDAKKIAVVGDFNNWNRESNFMKKTKNGKFQSTVELALGKEYQFRYLIDDNDWENDWEADGLVETPFEEIYNSMVKV